MANATIIYKGVIPVHFWEGYVVNLIYTRFQPFRDVPNCTYVENVWLRILGSFDDIF
jgi:hypothetical protein